MGDLEPLDKAFPSGHIQPWSIHTAHLWLQEDQKFLSQRVEGLQAELEVFAERSRQESAQLTSELQGTQQVGSGKQGPTRQPVSSTRCTLGLSLLCVYQ